MPRKLPRSNKGVNPRTAFGIVVRELRQSRGDSQESFAHLSGYHRNYIGQLERGEKSPSLNALFDFANTFGMRPSEILRSVEELVSARR
ncbi:MAG: helix-turn-helix transcriptional regulator [Terriglobales bacterium]